MQSCLPDCRDKSDENNCKILTVESSYNMRVPPITSADGTFKPVSVNVDIALNKIVSIDEVNHKIEFQFEISLKWRENRATYLNLKETQAMNPLISTDIGALWLPYVIYKNTG